jgi:AAA15 family ATPase/GTPase
MDSPFGKMLPVTVVYGANASGKTALYEGLVTMMEFVLFSSSNNSQTPIKVTPFLLNKHTAEEPTLFELSFILGEREYTYGFSTDATHVHEEWLYFKKPSGKKFLPCFVREGSEVEIDIKFFPEGKDKASILRPNALFLSLVDQLNGEISGKIIKWFSQLMPAQGIGEAQYLSYTIEKLEDPNQKASIVARVSDIDTSIRDLTVIESWFDPAPMAKVMNADAFQKMMASAKPIKSIKAINTIYDDKGKETGTQTFPFEWLSSGTKKYLNIIGILDEALKTGGVIFIDELDARFHPMLSMTIILLFNNPETNPKNAQLICTTHDVSLLDNERLRRDQIWFVEKTHSSYSQLYPLSSFKGVRSSSAYEKQYMEGRFGAIPMIDAV